MTVSLSVNLNAVALLRNRRSLPWPSVVGLGRLALTAGAHGLTLHPRPDERHALPSDLTDLRALIDDEFPSCELNIEGYPDDRFLGLVSSIEPNQVTLVPDNPEQETSDHGWNFLDGSDTELLAPIVTDLRARGYRVSLFCDADISQVEASASTGTDRIELYTGPYGSTYDEPSRADEELERLGSAADLARDLGLGVNAGHDLTVENLPALVSRVPHLLEVSIGHGLTADALEYGMAETVKRFLDSCVIEK